MLSKFLFFILLLAFVSVSCTENNSKKNVTHKPHIQDPISIDSLKEINVPKVKDTFAKEEIKVRTSVYESLGLIALSELDPTIIIDLKYATKDNFMKMKLYSEIKTAYLQKDVAERLVACQAYLKELHPNLSLLVYDAVRPVSVQQKMWDALDSIPFERRTKFVSNPKNGSIHNYGAAVDITLCDLEGNPLDMGAFYDDIREIAYPRLEDQFLASGELTEEQVANRKLLRKVMFSQGFKNIPTEWWHFNACSRIEAKKKYKVFK